MNVARLQVLQQRVLLSPRSIDMETFIDHHPRLFGGEGDADRPPTVDTVAEHCDTVACLAGWTVLLWAPQRHAPYNTLYSTSNFYGGSGPDVEDDAYVVDWVRRQGGWHAIVHLSPSPVAWRAAALLDLTSLQARNLFYVPHWPRDWQERYYGVPAGASTYRGGVSSQEDRARVVAHYIAYFVAKYAKDPRHASST